MYHEGIINGIVERYGLDYYCGSAVRCIIQFSINKNDLNLLRGAIFFIERKVHRVNNPTLRDVERSVFMKISDRNICYYEDDITIEYGKIKDITSSYRLSANLQLALLAICINSCDESCYYLGSIEESCIDKFLGDYADKRAHGLHNAIRYLERELGLFEGEREDCFRKESEIS